MKTSESVKNMEELSFFKDDMTTEEYTGYVESEQLNSLKKIESSITIIKNILIFIFAIGFLSALLHLLICMR